MLIKTTIAVCSAGIVMLIAVVAAAAQSTAQGARSSPQAVYQAERAACMRRAAGVERQSCLREMDAAQKEAKRGGLTASNEAVYEKNRLARCQVHKTVEDRAMCERLIKEGTVSGSVEGGGIYRELIIRETGPVPPN
jgi:uridine phosphorylase